MFSNKNSHNWQDRPLPPKLKLMLSLTIPFPCAAARPLAFLATVIVAVGAGILPLRAQNAGEAAASIDKRIEACSALIGKSGTGKDELIGFYLARGDAQRDKRQLDAAIEDYGQALKLDSRL